MYPGMSVPVLHDKTAGAKSTGCLIILRLLKPSDDTALSLAASPPRRRPPSGTHHGAGDPASG